MASWLSNIALVRFEKIHGWLGVSKYRKHFNALARLLLIKKVVLNKIGLRLVLVTLTV